MARKEGNIPCVIYDKKDPISVNINSVSTLKLYNTGRMLTTLLDLELSNGDKMKVIPKDIQIDPVKDNIHIDLLGYQVTQGSLLKFKLILLVKVTSGIKLVEY